MDIAPALRLIMKLGNDLELGLSGKYFKEYVRAISKDAYRRCLVARTRYIDFIRSKLMDQAIPYKFDTNLPVSTYYTTLAISNLFELTAMEQVDTLVDWLVEQQNPEGWWNENRELLDLDELEPWHNPANSSVRIFMTVFVASVLTRVSGSKYDVAIQQATKKLLQFTGDNGALLGFSQSSWLFTPVLARVYSTGSKVFKTHYDLLREFIDNQTNSQNTRTIARGLIYAGISTADPLFEKCKNSILQAYQQENGLGGWKNSDGELDPQATLSSLIILHYTDSSR